MIIILVDNTTMNDHSSAGWPYRGHSLVVVISIQSSLMLQSMIRFEENLQTH